MRIVIEIEADNAAFCPRGGCEVARILEDAAWKFVGKPVDSVNDFSLRDRNGNRVGFVSVVEEGGAA